MVFPEGIEVYTAIVVSIIFVLVGILTGLTYDEYKEADKERASRTREKKPETRDENATVTSEPSPAEKALLAANRQSLQMTMDALEAHRQLASAAMRQGSQPKTTASHTDAEAAP